MFDSIPSQPASVLDRQVFSRLAGIRDTPTETIDLNDVFAADPEATGTFDLRSLGSTSLGKLLDALPIPALLVDQWYGVVFCNEACSKIGWHTDKIYGSSFVDLLPRVTDVKKVAMLTDKAVAMLERAFKTRSPQRAEAILETGQHRIWALLHLRAVRMASQRHVLVLIEDLTSEKTQARVSQREESRLREVHDRLERQVQGLATELREARRRLKEESKRRTQAEQSGQLEERKFRLIAELCPHGIVLIGREGSFESMNSRFRESFGYDTHDFADTSEWIAKMFPVADRGQANAWNWLASAIASDQEVSAPFTSTVTCKEGVEKIAEFTLFRLHTGDHLMMCEELATFGE